MMSFMSCDYEASVSASTTAAGYEDEEPTTPAASTRPSTLLLPEATELDRLLVQATEAAIDAGSCSAGAAQIAGGASNGNNDGNNEDCDLHEIDSSPEATVIANHSADKKLKSRKKQKKQQQQQQQQQNLQPMTLKRRVRSLFTFMLNGSKSHQQQKQQRAPVNRSNKHDLEEEDQQINDVGRENAGCGGRCAKRHPVGSSVKGCRGGCVVAAGALPHNASNVQQQDEEGGTPQAGDEALDPPPAEETASQEPKQQQEAAQSIEEQSAAAPASAPARTPEPPSPSSQASVGRQPAPIPRPRMIRGGATTAEHRRVQESIFKECRIVPVTTLYKKVAMVPGRQRIFFSAPTNPRTMGSHMLYDIAYENFRHHSDCNRDFARVGLKKICSNYCQPSQFRYVY